MCSFNAGFGILTAIFLIIGLGILLGGVIPQSLLVKRAVSTSCHRFYTVRDRFCRYGAITMTCYDVNRNTQPDGATCWQAPTVATFTDRPAADSYAAQFASYYFACYTDPNDRCAYYTSLPDVNTLIWVGSIFTGLGVLCIVMLVVFNCCYHRFGYTKNDDTKPLI